MLQTWYVLEDGSVVPPKEVRRNAAGRLAHERGLVAMRHDGETPRSRSVDVDAVKAEPKPGAPAPAKPEAKPEAAPKQTAEMKPAASPRRRRSPATRRAGSNP